MFRNATHHFFHRPGITSQSRSLHRIKTDLTTRDATGNVMTKKVPVTIGDIDSTFVSIDPSIGEAFRNANPDASSSSANRCKLVFFHDSKEFGFDASSYPRLYIPCQFPRQSESNTSPATLIAVGDMDEIVLDGTEDAAVAEFNAESYFEPKHVLDPIERDPSDTRPELVTDLKCVLDELELRGKD